MRRSALLLAPIALVACGTPLVASQQPVVGSRAMAVAPASATQTVFRSTHEAHDRDLAADPVGVEAVAQRLAGEGRPEAGVRVFPVAAVRQPKAYAGPRVTAGIPVVGRLLADDLSGVRSPLAYATVEALGSGNKVVAATTTDAAGNFSLDIDPKFQRIGLTLSYRLANQFWDIEKYRWEGAPFTAGSGVDLGEVGLVRGTANAEAAWIHEIGVRYLKTFQREGVSLAFWKARIGITWPGSADYYSFGQVNMTQAKQWDVNGHEMGHAISDQGLNMRFGGGQHYIDRCYDETIAFSEGVASYLGLAVSVPSDAPNASFEFMVPRRAPLRYENVPDEKDPEHPDAPAVCRGPGNEWRAGAALWDLYDRNADGTDQVAIPFSTIWSAMAKGNGKPAIRSVLDAYKFVSEKVDPAVRSGMTGAAAQNFIIFKP